MKLKVWTASRAAAAGVLLAVSVAAAVEAQAVFTPDRSPTPGARNYANARVVAIDAQARTITVRSGGVGKDETFSVEAQALQRVGALKPGEQVVLTLRAGGSGSEVVTQIERSVAGAGARGGTATGRAAPRRRGSTGTPSTPTRPAPPTPTRPAPPAGPSPAASPAAASPAPSPEPTRLPTDIVGPLRDPRRDPNFDPRQNPLRDPRVVPGLSEPVPSPTPTPTPPPTPRG
jgi:hypothetical protein